MDQSESMVVPVYKMIDAHVKSTSELIWYASHQNFSRT